MVAKKNPEVRPIYRIHHNCRATCVRFLGIFPDTDEVITIQCGKKRNILAYPINGLAICSQIFDRDEIAGDVVSCQDDSTTTVIAELTTVNVPPVMSPQDELSVECCPLMVTLEKAMARASCQE